MRKTLIIFSGLPGTGKSTLAQLAVEKLHIPLLGIDEVVSAIPSHMARYADPYWDDMISILLYTVQQMKRYNFLIPLMLGLMLWLVQASTVSASCVADCSKRVLIAGCIPSPVGVVAQGHNLYVTGNCESCCSPPGGPLSCEVSTPRFRIADQQGMENGNFVEAGFSCFGQDVWRFDGQVEPGLYQLRAGESSVIPVTILVVSNLVYGICLVLLLLVVGAGVMLWQRKRRNRSGSLKADQPTPPST